MTDGFPDRRERVAGILLLLVTSVGWGLNWPAMKFLLTEWPPLFARGLSGLMAAALVAAIAVRRGESLAVRRALLARVAAHALLNVFAWMGFATLALQWLAAGQAAMLVYTMPVWAMLLAWPIAGKRPHVGGVLALAACLAGIAILLGARGAAFASSQWPGVAFALLAAVAFALGTVALRPLPLGAFASLAWQLVIGCAPMLAYGIAVERPDLRALSATGMAAMAYMTVFAMGICYLSWFAALRRLSRATAATGTLVTPVVGVVSGALALGEPLGPTQWIAMALVLGGVGLALRER